jgi:hypothetical protein
MQAFITEGTPPKSTNMIDDSGPGKTEEGLRCTWCGAPLQGQEMGNAKRPVCLKCVRLLTDAGLTDDEIFGGDSEKRE